MFQTDYNTTNLKRKVGVLVFIINTLKEHPYSKKKQDLIGLEKFYKTCLSDRNIIYGSCCCQIFTSDGGMEFCQDCLKKYTKLQQQFNFLIKQLFLAMANNFITGQWTPLMPKSIQSTHFKPYNQRSLDFSHYNNPIYGMQPLSGSINSRHNSPRFSGQRPNFGQNYRQNSIPFSGQRQNSPPFSRQNHTQHSRSSHHRQPWSSLPHERHFDKYSE